jgi:mRNA interferase MazF
MTKLRRGAVVLATDKSTDYGGKLRPMLVVQNDATLDISEGVTVCMFTTTMAETEPMRVAFQPAPANGLDQPSMLMIDKIATIRRHRVREVVGAAGAAKMREVDNALRRWLEL